MMIVGAGVAGVVGTVSATVVDVTAVGLTARVPTVSGSPFIGGSVGP
jgi:hypothetical protein